MDERYAAWNDALLREYFPETNAGRLACFPIDDDEIIALAANFGLCDGAVAVQEFVAAVRSEMGPRGDSFVRFTAWLAGWRRVRSAPPYVAGLALTVLAASRMQNDRTAGIASHNYYSQLNSLLGRPVRASSPTGFVSLHDAWEDLSVWLDYECGGQRGNSTVRTTRSNRHIGYPLSQSLLRACDRRRLPDFFKSAGLEPDAEISESRLFVLARAWAARPSCGLTPRARAAIANAVDIDRDEIAETLARELAAWDGELRDVRGRRRAPLHLLVIPRRRGSIVRLLGRRPDGFPTGAWRVAGSGENIELTSHATAAGWYAPLDFKVSKRVLQDGLRLISGDFALTFESADAVPCRQAAPEIGGYLSQPQATLWEPHIAVLRRSLAADLRHHLAGHISGAADLSSSESNLPAGWGITSEFRFNSIPRARPDEFSRLVPRAVATTSFSGGLPIGNSLYLTGGEPDVHIAVDGGAEINVELDEIGQDLEEGAITLELSRMRLEAGDHRLIADVTRTFSSVDTFGDVRPADAGTFGHLLARHRDYRPEAAFAQRLAGLPSPGWITLSGAVASGADDDLPLPNREPTLLRAAFRRYTVLGRFSDEHCRPRSRSVPAWLSQVGLGECCMFIEARPEFEAVWALLERENGTREIKYLAPEPVMPEPRVGLDTAKWIQAVLGYATAGGQQLGDLWREYVTLAESLQKDAA